ncbi:extracellular solute-binding protein, partial [bacterium]
MTKKLIALFSLLVVASMLFSACATPTAQEAQPTAAQQQPTTPPEPEKVTIAWWHINTAEGERGLWQKLADEYMAAHPNVAIEITVLENEAFKTKMTTVMQSGDPPDIFQSWGGGVMNEYAEAGLLRDITPELDADG